MPLVVQNKTGKHHELQAERGGKGEGGSVIACCYMLIHPFNANHSPSPAANIQTKKTAKDALFLCGREAERLTAE